MIYFAPMMTLKEVLPNFDGKKNKLAAALGITKQAVSSWDPDKPIPKVHELVLRYEILPSRQSQRAAQKTA